MIRCCYRLFYFCYHSPPTKIGILSLHFNLMLFPCILEDDQNPVINNEILYIHVHQTVITYTE